MSTVQEMHDELGSFDGNAADAFKAEMVAAMMGTDVAFTAKGSAALRAVAQTWSDKRNHLKKMATDPAYRAMIVGDVAERYGLELPIEAELEALPTEDDADDATGTDGDENTNEADADSEHHEPSFV